MKKQNSIKKKRKNQNMKITAKGMFKRLGYKREIILNYRFISYRKPRGTSFCYIQFDLKEKNL